MRLFADRRRRYRPLRQRFREGLRITQSHPDPSPLPAKLRLLTFNIQAAIGSNNYRDYITGSWKHLLAHGGSLDNLQHMAVLLSDYDIVALQEVDGGSLRSRHINQLDFLAQQAGFPFRYQQLNRNLGRLGQFCNGLLSRPHPYHVENHRLPGLPGRGAIIAFYGDHDDPLVVVALHLALGKRYQQQQLDYLARRLKPFRRLVVMGDFNCGPASLRDSPLVSLGLRVPAIRLASYPSWAPERMLDQVLVSADLKASGPQVLNDYRLSDHLPVALELQL